jgi:hypothetical protein
MAGRSHPTMSQCGRFVSSRLMSTKRWRYREYGVETGDARDMDVTQRPLGAGGRQPDADLCHVRWSARGASGGSIRRDEQQHVHRCLRIGRVLNEWSVARRIAGRAEWQLADDGGRRAEYHRHRVARQDFAFPAARRPTRTLGGQSETSSRVRAAWRERRRPGPASDTPGAPGNARRRRSSDGGQTDSLPTHDPSDSTGGLGHRGMNRSKSDMRGSSPGQGVRMVPHWKPTKERAWRMIPRGGPAWTAQASV